MDRVILDSNILMQYPEAVDLFPFIALPVAVLEELDKLNMQEGEVGFKARRAIRKIEQADNVEFLLDGFDKDKYDNQILFSAKKHDYTLVSNDVCMRAKSHALHVSCEGFSPAKDNKDYMGYRIVTMDEEEMAQFYETKENRYEIKVNEFLIVKDITGIVVDKFKYTKNGFRNLQRKNLKSSFFGEVKPKDLFQECAVDSLLTDPFTVLTGKAGSGKSFLSLSYALYTLAEGKYDKIVIAYNPCTAKGAKQLGFYSGNRDQKLFQTSLGSQLIAKFGDISALQTFIKQDKILLMPVGDIRGCEITDGQILYVPEAQNLSIDLCKLIIQRCAEGSKLIMEGDINCQVDSHQFEDELNGLRRAMEIFRGSELFSMVHLPVVHRSKLAELADQM